MRIKDVQNRIDKYLKYSDALQNNDDFRLKIVLYTFGEVVQHSVYELFYKHKNPLRSSLKIFCADAVIQVLIYMRQRGMDLREIIELGLDKVTRDREYEKKLLTGRE